MLRTVHRAIKVAACVVVTVIAILPTVLITFLALIGAFSLLTAF